MTNTRIQSYDEATDVTERAEDAQENERERTSEREDVEVCPECGGNLATQDNETVCEECGLVVEEDNVDRGPEW